jgi:hypothetical protein
MSWAIGQAKLSATAYPQSVRGAVILGACLMLAACGGGGSGGDTDPAVGPPTSSFSGNVTFKGTPLSGVTIVAFDTNNNKVFGTTTTDAQGNYSFSGMNTSCTQNCLQDYQFLAFKSGYAFSPVLANVPAQYTSSMQWYVPPAGFSTPDNWYNPTGVAITRAGYNGQYVDGSNGVSAPIVYTVFNYSSITAGPSGPTDSITGATFVAFDGSNPLVQLAASGQAVSYQSGDDASVHAGVAWPATRFVDNANGTVTDELTGLVWLKTAGCLVSADWTTAMAEAQQLAIGACGLSDGSKAGEWRAPNVWEMESVVDESASLPALTAGSPFTNVASGGYWTSTSIFGDPTSAPFAWAVDLTTGQYIDDQTTNAKTNTLAVWAVKGTSGAAVTLQATGYYIPYTPGDDGTIAAGVALPTTRMIDNGNGTETDSVTGLVWLQQASCAQLQGTWSVSIAAVNALQSGQCGLTDGSTAGQWRMPNRKEMESLADRIQTNEADFFDMALTSADTGLNSVSAVFANFVTLQYYWTSTTQAGNTNSAWTVFSCDWGVYTTPKSQTGYTLAVR